MEAFSDGVFAIAITLLVLDLAVPEPGSGVGHALLDQWPLYTAYLVSFASVGAVWIAHSTITNHLERVDSVLLRLNLLLLFFVSVLPFPTKMLAEFMGDFGPERIAVTIYGLNLLAMSAMTSVVWRHAVARRDALRRASPRRGAGGHQEVDPQSRVLRGGDRDRLARAPARGLPLPRDRAVPAHPIPRGLAAPPQADAQ